MIREIEVGDQVRVKETGEIGLVRHIMFYKPFHFFIGKKTYMVGDPAKSYEINEIELFDKQIEREEKINRIYRLEGVAQVVEQVLVVHQ
jgi:hypothetical protein